MPARGRNGSTDWSGIPTTLHSALRSSFHYSWAARADTGHRALRSFLWIGLAAMAVAVIHSGSRFGIMMAAVGALIALRSELRWPLWSATLLCGLLCTLVIAIMPDKVERRFQGFSQAWNGKQQGEAYSLIERTNLVRAGVAMIGTHPLQGVGLGGFRAVSWQYWPGLRKDKPAHNMYIEVAGELGLPALFMLLAIFVLVRRRSRRILGKGPNAPPDSPDIRLYRRLFIAWLLMLFCGLYRNFEYDPTMWAIMGLLVAGSEVLGSRAIESPRDTLTPVRPNAGTGSA